MVKIKHLTVLLFLVSCGDKVTTLKNGVTVVPNDLSIFNNSNLFDKSLLLTIDTSAIYKEAYGYLSASEESFVSTNNIRSSRSDKFLNYYKFYANGLVNLFTEPQKTAYLTLDSSYSGYRGVYYKKKDKIYLELYVIKKYGLKPKYGISKDLLLIKGDTIFMKSLNNPKSISVAIKM